MTLARRGIVLAQNGMILAPAWTTFARSRMKLAPLATMLAFHVKTLARRETALALL